MSKLSAVGLCALVFVLGGCGGGGSGDSALAPQGTDPDVTATAPQGNGPTQAAHERAAAQKENKGKQAEGSPGNPNASEKQRTTTVKVPPISSAPIAGSTKPAPGVKTVKGGDNSVQTYGVEASEDERTQAAIALQAYLNARTQEDWEGVCSYLAQRAKDQLQTFIKSAQGKTEGLSGCADAMAAFGKGTAGSSQDPTIAEVLSFRGEGDVPGDPSYLIFTGSPGQTLYSMPMYLEAGGWKVGLALPAELPV